MVFEFANTTISGALTTSKVLMSSTINIAAILLTVGVIAGALVSVYFRMKNREMAC